MKIFLRNSRKQESFRWFEDHYLTNQNTKRLTIQEPPQNQTQMVFDLYKQGLHQDALDQNFRVTTGVS